MARARQLSLGLDRSSIRILHAADLHLDSPLRGLARYEGAPVEEIRGATRRAFDQLIDLAIAERVSLLLLAGDLYDGDWRDYNTGLYFAARMHRLRDEGIDVALARGNHDAQSRITRALRLPPNVRELSIEAPETVVFEPIGVAVHGQSYAEPALTEDLATRYPAAIRGMINIGLLHTALEGREGHAPYAPTTARKLKNKGYDYWALGHVHQREVVAKEPWIVFPGNLQGRQARERGPKGATLLTLLDGRIAEVEARALDVVRFETIEVDAEGARTIDAIVERVDHALAAASRAAEERLLAARVRIRGVSPAHRALASEGARVEAEVRLLAQGTASRAWIERVELDTRSPLDLDRIAEASGPIAALLTTLRDVPGHRSAAEMLVEDLRQFRSRVPEKLWPELGLGGEIDEHAVARLAPALEQLLVPLLLEGEDPR